MKIKNTKKITYRKGNIPCIIIEGKFLKKLGFNLGDIVNIDYAKNKITISKNRKVRLLCSQDSLKKVSKGGEKL